MAREIKFRAWSKSEKKWVFFGTHPRRIYWSSPEYISQSLGGDESAVYFEELEDWLQYTGLKDKNGVEIYEGDLITNHGVTNDLKRREFEVVWNGVNARFSVHDIRANLRTSIDLDSASECEIIGNIYED